MLTRTAARAVSAAFLVLAAGCSSPLNAHHTGRPRDARTIPAGAELPSRVIADHGDETSGGSAPSDREEAPASLDDHASPDDYIRYALAHSPAVEAAYQRWSAAAERLPQVGALPDPRLSIGFFLDEVETRTGPQQARLGISQAFPWPGLLRGLEDAEASAARAAWRRLEAERLAVTERVVHALHELAYLDAATGITEQNLELLVSFEEVVRARYRVGAGSHPELTRVQVELGLLDDRLTQLRAMRPAYAAELNAALGRPANTDVPTMPSLPGRKAALDGQGLAELAAAVNPSLLALDEQTEEQRARSAVAEKDGLPRFSVGLDYIVTGDAMDSSIPESGDDPVLLSFGITLPIWREKYDAGVRETIARRLAIASERADAANRVAAQIQRAWFEHTDADRRVGLYEHTLIPKAEESLRASLAGFRAGDTGFLDLLDTERTLLEFAIAAERARADRGQALAKLNQLVGTPVPTEPAAPTDPTTPTATPAETGASSATGGTR